MPKCVAFKCEVKDIFDKAHTKAVTGQIRKTLEREVGKGKNLVFDPNCKDGWELRVQVLTLKVDNPTSPTTMETKVYVGAVSFGKEFKGMINAEGGAKASGVRAKKLEDEAKQIVDDALGELLKKKIIPELDKRSA